jgi:hypothetical protein
MIREMILFDLTARDIINYPVIDCRNGGTMHRVMAQSPQWLDYLKILN